MGQTGSGEEGIVQTPRGVVFSRPNHHQVRTSPSQLVVSPTQFSLSFLFLFLFIYFFFIVIFKNSFVSSSRYREYAFIRTEDEREQFLYHLLTLTAREFSCFTSAFVQTSKSTLRRHWTGGGIVFNSLQHIYVYIRVNLCGVCVCVCVCSNEVSSISCG